MTATTTNGKQDSLAAFLGPRRADHYRQSRERRERREARLYRLAARAIGETDTTRVRALETEVRRIRDEMPSLIRDAVDTALVEELPDAVRLLTGRSFSHRESAHNGRT